MTLIAIQPVRVYADTSVYGGVFDEEFPKPSRTFFEQVQAGRYRLVRCPLLEDELEDAPPQVRQWYQQFDTGSERAEVSEAAVLLQQAYLRAGIVERKWEADALHVAVATVSGCRVIVSWNFKHIVNFQKIPLYNGANLSHGFAAIAIHSPQEVIEYENQDV
jgi:predicted nucleic acid-binding protein